MLNSTLADVIRHCRIMDELVASEERGTFTITADGQLEGLTGEYLVGQWIQVAESINNDALYQISSIDAVSGVVTLSNGTDDSVATHGEEAFSGVARGLRMPLGFIGLVEEILTFNESSGAPSPYTSESVLGVHSWSKGSKSSGAPVTWFDVFSDKLAPFRRLPIPAVKI